MPRFRSALRPGFWAKATSHYGALELTGSRKVDLSAAPRRRSKATAVASRRPEPLEKDRRSLDWGLRGYGADQDFGGQDAQAVWLGGCVACTSRHGTPANALGS